MMCALELSSLNHIPINSRDLTKKTSHLDPSTLVRLDYVLKTSETNKKTNIM